jgi:hypothetical protein
VFFPFYWYEFFLSSQKKKIKKSPRPYEEDVEESHEVAAHQDGLGKSTIIFVNIGGSLPM